MRIATRLSVAACAASAMFAAPASAQLIEFTTTGFFTGGGSTPCTAAVIGATATCSYTNGSRLQFNGATLQSVVGAGVALLLAPASGRETRKVLGERFDKLSDAASEKIREIQEDVPSLLGRDGASQTARTPSSRSGAAGHTS